MNYANFPLDKRMPLPSTDPEKGEDFIDIERLLGMAARQTKVVAVCAVIGLFLGVIYLQTTPKQYMSVSSVLIDEGLNKVVDDISAASATMQTDASLLSQIEILTSARLASVVVDKLGRPDTRHGECRRSDARSHDQNGDARLRRAEAAKRGAGTAQRP
jgi:succinoglycan biosynthesis transport protein ExoP